MANPVRIFSNVAVSAAQDHISDIVVADDDVVMISFHFLWEGTPTGTFALYQSNLPQPGRNPTGKGWVPVPAAEVDFTGKNPGGSGGSSLVNISATSGSKYIIVYSHASGAGNLDCFQVSKAAGAVGEIGPKGPVGPAASSVEFTHPHQSFQTNALDGWMFGFLEFDAGNDDFTVPATLGAANKAKGAHIGVVQGAVSVDQITLRFTGNSVNDLGVEILADTEDIVIEAGAANRYFETVKKWNGQPSISNFAGTAVAWNFGFVKYWDHANQDFRLDGFEAVWESDSNDAGSDIEVLHHKATGWTYQAAGGPTHDHIAQRSADFTDNEQSNGQGAWKRTNLSVDINGADAEGIIVHVISGSTSPGQLSFRTLNFTLSTRTGL